MRVAQIAVLPAGRISILLACNFYPSTQRPIGRLHLKGNPHAAFALAKYAYSHFNLVIFTDKVAKIFAKTISPRLRERLIEHEIFFGRKINSSYRNTPHTILLSFGMFTCPKT